MHALDHGHSKYALSIGKGNSSRTHEDFEKIDRMYHVWFQHTDKDVENDSLNLNQSSDYVEFVNNKFTYFAQEFLRIQDAAKTTVNGLAHIRYISQLIKPLPYWVLLAPILLEDSLEERQKKIDIAAKFLEIYIIRKIWNGIPIRFDNFHKPLFEEIVTKIRNFNSEQLKIELKKYLDKEEYNFSEALELTTTNRDKIHHILARLTEFIEVGSKMDSSYEEHIRNSSEKSRNSYSVEHIWPKNDVTLKNELGNNEFELMRNKLGGLLLLPISKNSELGAKSYEKKLDVYKEQNLLAKSLCSEIYGRFPDFKNFCNKESLPFEPHSKFGVQELQERNDLYCKIAEKIWNSNEILV